MPLEIYHRSNSPVRIVSLRRALRVLCAYAKVERAWIELHLTGEKTLQKLNREYRAKDKTTDVLSFPVDIQAPFKEGPWHLGSIFIATAMARQQAKRAGRNLNAQILRLAVHGLVHLQGLDHEKGLEDAKIFEKKERKYLKYLSQQGHYPWDGSLQF